MKTINLPRLEIAHRNFASTCVAGCGRRWALYQVDVASRPFWCVEIGQDHKPTGPATKYESHADAISWIAAKARGFLLGETLAVPDVAG